MSAPRIAFFGATGGCACSALANALKAGYSCSALVRNTTKLTTILTDSHGIEPSSYLASGALTIIEGDISSQDGILSTISGPTGSRLADFIVSGLGSTPSFQWSITTPVTTSDLTICERATRAILAAVTTLRDANPAYRPTITVVSTTGTSARRDVPLLMYPIYHWLLQVPHADKRKMEAMLFDGGSSGKAEGGHAYDFVVVRPTMLTDGACRGLEKVRAGWENPDTTGEGPQMGYTVSRKDVGNWIFERVVREGKDGRYLNKCVTLTY